MPATTLTVNVAGTPDTADRLAMILAIDRANEQRQNTGLALLPKSTAAERKASYETILAAVIASSNTYWLDEAAKQADNDASFRSLKPLWLEANSTKRAAATAALQ